MADSNFKHISENALIIMMAPEFNATL